MSLRSRCEKRAKLARARLEAFERPNPSLKPLHTDAAVRSRVLTLNKKVYKRVKKVEVCDV